MDQAELVLAAKAVTDELQNIAIKIAKMEANGIMPLLDAIRLNFGEKYAEQLSNDASDALTAVLDAVKEAKTKIGKNIGNMQQIVTGEGPGNDMAQNSGVTDEPTVDDLPHDDDMEPSPDNTELPEPESTDEPTDEKSGVSKGSEGSPDIKPGVDDIDSFFDKPVGRATKESRQTSSFNLLAESSPNAIIFNETIKLSKQIGMERAIRRISERFNIKQSNVVSIIKENK